MDNGATQILITGATGFLGSSLAARFLTEARVPNQNVLALSRNDPNGERTLAAIENAADGFRITLPRDWRSRVTVIECDFSSIENFEALLARSGIKKHFSKITDVWNCAAQMSYSPKKLSASVLQNVGITTTLYRHIQKHSPACRRFYHVSTAYTAGMKGGDVSEELHTHPLLINGYQTSKWGAELALSHLASTDAALPVTIFRPTIIMGHRETGWSNGHPFGFYMFLEALKRAKQAGAACIRIDVDPEQNPNVISVDEVVGAAIALCGRGKSRQSEPNGSTTPLEIFHIANRVNRSSFTTRNLVNTMAEAVGVQVKYEKPLTYIDRQIDKGIAWNREFASTTWNFKIEKLEAVLAAQKTQFCEKPLTQQEVRRACDHYLRAQVTPKSNFFTPAMGLITRVEAAALSYFKP